MVDRNSSRGGRDSERSSRGGREDSGRGSSRSSAREYRPRDASAVKKRQEEMSGGDFDSYFRPGTKVFKPHDKDNIIRILEPTWPDADHYGFDIYLHYKVGPDEQTYLCLKEMKGEPCPLCEERAQAVRDKDDDYADSLKPKKRVVVALVDRDAENEGVQLWSMPWGVDKDLIGRVQDRRTGEVLPLDDPEHGYDVEFTKEGTGLKTKYVGISLARRESPLGDDKWRDHVFDNPIPDTLAYYSYDHIQGVFGGVAAKTSDRDTGSRQSKEDKDEDQLRSLEKGRGGRGSQDETPSWDAVHGMQYEELDAMIDEHKLKITANDSKDDEELADWICEDLGIKKTPARRSVAEDTSTSDKLADMRSRRAARE